MLEPHGNGFRDEADRRSVSSAAMRLVRGEARRWLGALLPGLVLALTLSSCAEHQELQQNNDPDRYAVVEDVLWASPATAAVG